MQAERRQSLRLRGERPQVEETSFQCHFCLVEDDACRIGTVFLPCCKKFVHKKCQIQWQLNNSTCALCRQETIVLPMPETQEDFDIPWEPVDEGNQAMTNRQVIERLEGLLASEGLRNQFDQVRASFFHFFPTSSVNTNFLPSPSILFFLTACQSTSHSDTFSPNQIVDSIDQVSHLVSHKGRSRTTTTSEHALL